MKNTKYRLLAITIGLASSVSTIAIAQEPKVIGTLANNDGIFIDGRTFTIVPGRPRAGTDIRKLGAREIGPGAIIFRFEDKLYIADAAESIVGYVTDPDWARQRARGLRDVDIERQRPLGLRSDLDVERQRPLGLRDTDIERQRPLGLRDADIERQRPLGLRSDLDVERQRPLGLRDLDIERQRPLGLRSDLDVERQRPLGLRDIDLDIERQRPLGLRSDLDVERQRPLGLRDIDLDIERQRPLGLRSDLDVERQRPLGMRDAQVAGRYRVYINDPDYAYYKVKKAFEENWDVNLAK